MASCSMTSIPPPHRDAAAAARPANQSPDTFEQARAIPTASPESETTKPCAVIAPNPDLESTAMTRGFQVVEEPEDDALNITAASSVVS